MKSSYGRVDLSSCPLSSSVRLSLLCYTRSPVRFRLRTLQIAHRDRDRPKTSDFLFLLFLHISSKSYLLLISHIIIYFYGLDYASCKRKGQDSQNQEARSKKHSMNNIQGTNHTSKLEHHDNEHHHTRVTGKQMSTI
jgi:hypothetical protein